MKKLFIIRHAKSSWEDETLDDFDRPLNNRGFKNAVFMGKLLKKKDTNPDLIISSPALRTTITSQIIVNEIDYKKTIIFEPSIYEANENILKEIIKNLKDGNNIVFLIGHNPGLSNLVGLLTSKNEDIPTCGIIEIDFQTNSWSEISKENSKLISFEYPKKYK